MNRPTRRPTRWASRAARVTARRRAPCDRSRRRGVERELPLEQFDAERVEAAKTTVWMTGCRSRYLDNRGIPAVWPWTFDRFREEMAQPRQQAYELAG